MKKVIAIFFSLFFVHLLLAQNVEFPVNTTLRINRPQGLPFFQPSDIVVDANRLNSLPDDFIYGSKLGLRQLADYLINDNDGRLLWERETKYAAHVLNSWDFMRSGLDYGFISCFCTDRYIYCVTQLEKLSYIYLLSGHPALGRFIREHLLQLAKLPVDFWCHSELRRYTPEKPLGMIETADICTAVSVGLSATKGILSADEESLIETALREKGLNTSLDWLETPRMNNFAGIIASGAYVAAKCLNDQEGMSKALEVLKDYVNTSIEDDGSYGEGFSYFEYPVRSMMPAILAMSPTEIAGTFSNSGMARSGEWLVYPFLYPSANGKKYLELLHFADNGYAAPVTQSVNYILARLFNDPLATWLTMKSNGKAGFSEKLLEYKLPGKLPAAQSPSEKGLPLLKHFDSGHCYIRSSWQDDAIVMALWSGDGSRVKFSHQRPELNSICLGAFGEYLVVSPASASYRSALRGLYDQATRSANTISIDDHNQLFKPARVTLSFAGKSADLLVSEAALAYHVPMKNAVRAVLFVRDPGYFVVIDKLEALNSDHKFTWRMHLNNKDDLGMLRTAAHNRWNFHRGRAYLDIFLFASQPILTKTGQGLLHGPGRDYSPGGIYEGQPGSAIELEAYNPENTKAMIYYSVLFPSQKKLSSPLVQFSGGKLLVGNDAFTFSNGKCTFEKGRTTETFNLW